jgi:hypothetical protein
MRSFRLSFLLVALTAVLFVACGDDNNPTKSKLNPTSNYGMSLGFSRTSWTQASEPAQALPGGVPGKAIWFTPMSFPRVEDVYPDSLFPDYSNGSNATIQTLRIVFRPVDADRPFDQWLTNHGVTLPARPAAHAPSWAGIMREVPYFEFDADTKFFTVRLRTANATVHFDFGQFREDLDGDGYLITEDVNDNSITDFEEDTGLDGLADQFEPGYDPATNADPQRDNWYFRGYGNSPAPENLVNALEQDLSQQDAHPLAFEWINGTDGNRDDIVVAGRPDDEQLGATPVLSEDYFSYVITPGTAPDPYHVAALDYDGWRTYQIPLRDLNAIDTIVGSPLWKTVRYVRVWLEVAADVTASDSIEIADWHFGQ